MNRLSKHAHKRGQQRGISTKQIQLVMDYGRIETRPGNASLYSLSRKEVDRQIQKHKQAIQLLEKSKGIGIVVGKDTQEIITIYHKY